MPKVTTPFTLPTQYRQAIFYALLFAGTGASLPFMPLWFKSHGMSAGQIGLILAMPLLLRAVTGPLSGLWADRFSLYRTPMVVLALAAGIFYALMSIGTVFEAWRFPAYLVLFTLGFSCMTSISPLIDSMSLQLSRLEGFAYALPRAVGSASFMLTNVTLGFILLIAPADTVLIWVVAAASLVAIGGRFWLAPKRRLEVAAPAIRQPRGEGLKRVGDLMRNEGLLWLLIAVGCMQAAHSFYYAFSTLIWKSNGLSSITCGYLWAVGVIGEIAFMSLGEPLRRRMGPWRMLLIGGIGGVVRWGIMMLSPPLWLLYPLQLFHALTFAAAYLAGLELVHRLSPKGYEGLAQTLNAAYANGVMMGIGTLASGAVYELFGARGYGLMAVVAGIGLMSAIWLYSQRKRLLIPTVSPQADAGQTP